MLARCWKRTMDFVILGNLRDVTMIAVGTAIRDLPRLRRAYGAGRWRKMKGNATIRTFDGLVKEAEVHWYEAHGIGKKEFKIKDA
jgi:hypothetical protein